jgi:hypothetical protein
MKLLREIKDKDFDKVSGWKLRGASRAVLFDSKGLVPLLFVSKHNYYKLPGGGMIRVKINQKHWGGRLKRKWVARLRLQEKWAGLLSTALNFTLNRPPIVMWERYCQRVIPILRKAN